MSTSHELLAIHAEALGWALLHSLWQGAIVAVVLSIVLGLLRQAAARHAACLVALLALTIITALTAWQLRPGPSPRVSSAVAAPASADAGSVLLPPMAIATSEAPALARITSSGAASAPSPLTWSARLRPWVPWVAAFWACGVVGCSLRHSRGWWQLRVLRQRSRDARPEWQKMGARLALCFGLHRGVRLLESAEAGGPMLTGLLAPVVLLPARLATGLSTAELEAILAHELAHLARHDAWNNAAQLAIETLFFFHPAVWWIGHCARQEREHAADDLALRVCTNRRLYAGALARLAELQCAPSPALAASGGNLLARIRRIVRPAQPEPVASGWSLGLPALLTLFAMAVVFGARADDAKIITVAPGESIQRAIDGAPAGAIVRLSAGEWKERVVIAKALTLEGAGWEKTRITIEEPSPDEMKKAQAEMDVRRQAATTPDGKRGLEIDSVRLRERPALFVHGAAPVTIRALRVQGVSTADRESGGTLSTLLHFHGAKATVSDCAVVGPFGHGIAIAAGADVEVRRSLVAAIWRLGISVRGRAGESGPASRLHLVESEVRNVYLYGISIGSGCDSTVIERCRISGTAWHGIRYDDASPSITGNAIFAHARSSIYASGKTHATVRGNLFWQSEMNGMSCWFENADTIEGNTFVGNLREGLAVLGGAKPKVTRNIFTGHPIAITCHPTNGANPQAGLPGDPVLQDNLFWENKIALQIKADAKPAPAGSRSTDPQFLDATQQNFALAGTSPARAANIGVAQPLSPGSPWPLLAEEKAIIPAGDTREFNYWTAPGGAKPSKAAADQTAAAREKVQPWLTDAFQLDDAAKRTAAIERIRQAIASPDTDMARTGLVAFQQVTQVEFDKASFRPVFRPLLQAKEPDLRALACGALASTGANEEDLDRVLALVDDPAPEVRLALPFALKNLSPDGFTGKTGAGVLKLLDSPDAKVIEGVWHAMWGTKISPELEVRVVEASRKDDRGSGYSTVFYYALTVHLSKGEPTVTRLIELTASQDTVNVAGRCLWGIRQGLADDQKPRVAELALKVLAARSDVYMRREALACLKQCGNGANAAALRELLAKPGTTGEFKGALEEVLGALTSRPEPTR